MRNKLLKTKNMFYRNKKSFLFVVFCLLFLASPVSAQIIPVPFTSQAPQSDWRQPWQDACEETSIAMVNAYYQNFSFTPEKARKEILAIFDLKHKLYSESLDESILQVQNIIQQFLPWEAFVVEEPTLEQIKEELNNGRPVIIPVYGKALKNTNFKNGGPTYHMIVLSGYDDKKQQFFTQEPGTRLGKNFPYSYATILNAIHDYLPENQTPSGAKRVLFTSSQISDSAMTDGDGDGLFKKDEVVYGTSLSQADSDHDGYSDGEEIEAGYSPLVNETKLGNGSLIKTSTEPQVYYLENRTKKLIPDEQTFHSHGWKWSDIITVSEPFFNSLYSV